MQRLRRILANALALISLALCLAIGLLWIRSYYRTDHLEHARWAVLAKWEMQTSRGRANLTCLDDDISLFGQVFEQKASFNYYSASTPTAADEVLQGLRNYPHIRSDNAMFGFAFFSAAGNPGGDFPLGPLRFVSVPFWLPFLLTGILPAWRGRQIVRAWQAKRSIGKCQTCGYDLRASPERCPECGALVDPHII